MIDYTPINEEEVINNHMKRINGDNETFSYAVSSLVDNCISEFIEECNKRENNVNGDIRENHCIKFGESIDSNFFNSSLSTKNSLYCVHCVDSLELLCCDKLNNSSHCVYCSNCKHCDDCRNSILCDRCRQCKYCDECKDCKKCSSCSNCSNCHLCKFSKNMDNCNRCTNSENDSGCSFSDRCINCVSCKQCKNCVNCYFCTDCQYCKNCVGITGGVHDENRNGINESKNKIDKLVNSNMNIDVNKIIDYTPK